MCIIQFLCLSVKYIFFMSTQLFRIPLAIRCMISLITNAMCTCCRPLTKALEKYRGLLGEHGMSNLVILCASLEYPTWLFCASSWNIQLGYSACPLGISNLVILRATLEYPTWLFRKMRHFSKGDKIYSYNLVTILCPLCIAFVFDV